MTRAGQQTQHYQLTRSYSNAPHSEGTEYDDFDIGVVSPKPDPNDELTLDEIAWAVEQGAKSTEDVIRIVREDRERELEDVSN